MRKLISVLMLSTMVCAISGCSKNGESVENESPQTTVVEEISIPEESSVPEETTEKPSGYENGNVQKQYLYCNGNLYEYSRVLDGLTKENIGEKCSGFSVIGTINDISNTAVPNTEFQASNLETDYEVYGNADEEERIIVDCKDNFIEMKLVEN